MFGAPRIGTKVAFALYQPYSKLQVRRWLVIGTPGAGSVRGCGVYLNQFTAAYWEYPTASTWGYVSIPDAPFLIGQTFIVQGLVRVGNKVDLSRGLRITIEE